MYADYCSRVSSITFWFLSYYLSMQSRFAHPRFVFVSTLCCENAGPVSLLPVSLTRTDESVARPLVLVVDVPVLGRKVGFVSFRVLRRVTR